MKQKTLNHTVKNHSGSNQTHQSLRCAQEILSLLYRFYQPKSVIDVGCGDGAWLLAAESLGSQKLKGLDTNHVKDGMLSSNCIEFSAVDLSQAFDINDQYDLCISVEVAEHIPSRAARNFVEQLCRASDVVLFSAAIVDQGGDNHINEQWPSYWAEIFQSHNYECLDVFRAAIWESELVEWWYRQNILLFVNPQTTLLNVDAVKAEIKPVLNIVHPLNYQRMKWHNEYIAGAGRLIRSLMNLRSPN
ncbi:MAG: methyltransferase domain-containing protein [Caldilineaceae bacterium]